MKNQFPVLVLALVILISGCTKNKHIANLKDFNACLQPTSAVALKNCNEEIAFWTNKNSVSPSLTYQAKIGGAYSKRFGLTGKIEDTFISDSLYRKVVKADSSRTGTYLALAVNCMTRHEFQQAKKYINKALSNGDNRASSLFCLFDVDMELGDYAGAKYILSHFENKNSFAFLIRQAKVDDHEGHLELAIQKMERALDRMKDDPSLYCWTLSNLGDMYGHAGRIEEAYKAYLNVLKKDQFNYFALKGIGWIAFSHDRNTGLATQIASALAQRKQMPDMHLMLGKIAEEKNDSLEKKTQLQLFAAQASLPKYGNMYNKYIALLDADEFGDPGKTLIIAKTEVKNRPTPQSYDLLAWGYYKTDQLDKALAIAQQHVEGKTFEPEALYHLGMIYNKRDETKSKELLSLASKSEFELGPSIATIIEQYLK